MNKYVVYTLVFLAGVALSNKVRQIPVIGPAIPNI